MAGSFLDYKTGGNAVVLSRRRQAQDLTRQGRCFQHGEAGAGAPFELSEHFLLARVDHEWRGVEFVFRGGGPSRF